MDHPDIVRKMLRMAASVREELGEYGSKGTGQRPTGSVFPDVPVISHPRDWEKLPLDIRERTYKNTYRINGTNYHRYFIESSDN